MTDFTDPGSYYSHTLNAYDDGHSVVVDFITFPAPFLAAGRGTLSDGPSALGTPRLDRLTIDLKHGRARSPGFTSRPRSLSGSTEAGSRRPDLWEASWRCLTTTLSKELLWV